jgi:hypothetical protein
MAARWRHSQGHCDNQHHGRPKSGTGGHPQDSAPHP